MFSKFFINRPIFASVVSIVIVIAGLVTLLGLPIAQYPDLAPPTVTVTTVYPGANAQVVADTVAAPIEQEVNGVEDMIYMSSVSSNDGSYSLTVTFETGTDLDMAAVLVQNRVAIAINRLPEEVKRQGVTTKKKSTDFAMMINIISPDGRYDDIFLTNFATLNIRDELSRISGAGDVLVLGAGSYSMRIWLDPEQLKARGLTTSDVYNAIREQNVQVAAGTIGQAPAPQGQSFQYTVNVQGRLEQPEEFGAIVVKTGRDGRLTRIRDVARVELGAEAYEVVCKLNGKPTSLIQVFQLPGANLLNLTEQITETMERLGRNFPEGIEYVIAYNAADVVEASIDEIVETLFIAALLVILTVFVFLQDWRATLIPTITIPVSLIGTFAVMSLLGFSINTLTLFGMVLAIGIVVDDAIVVVENTSRNIDETGLSPKEATLKAMEEVSGPVVATTLVLLAVFVPTAFMGGLTGVMYKQFALTIATTTVFSSINALTLSPALCAIVLRRSPEKRNWFFRGFNWLLNGTRKGYMGVVGVAIRRTLITFVLFGGICAAAYWGLITIPTGFVPEEDQGYMIVSTQLPDAASSERAQAVAEKVNTIIENTPGVRNNISVAGYSVFDSASASYMNFNVVVLEPWGERTTPEVQIEAIQGALWYQFSGIQEAIVVPFIPPALPGLGMAGGFEMRVQDRGGLGLNVLQTLVGQLIDEGNGQPSTTGLYTTFRASLPQLYAEIDRTRIKQMDIPLNLVFDTMQSYLGSSYVNDFNKFGRTYQVRMQADAQYRSRPEDIAQLRVRAPNGRTVPLGSLMDIREVLGPQIISRYNMFPDASIKGMAAPGYSSGQALATMSTLAENALPPSMGFAWTGLSYQELAAGNQAPFILALAAVFVFLVLAAQYESWKIPIPVLLSVPMALLGAVAALMSQYMDNNVYTQIGLVLLIGLATKNAILIVEFGKEAYDKGMTPVQAAIQASTLRFRPILMTAFSFILGVIPLLIATGAGAASRRALGTAVFGGMLAATVLGVIFVPPLYVIFQKLGVGRKLRKEFKERDKADRLARKQTKKEDRSARKEAKKALKEETETAPAAAEPVVDRPPAQGPVVDRPGDEQTAPAAEGQDGESEAASTLDVKSKPTPR